MAANLCEEHESRMSDSTTTFPDCYILESQIGHTHTAVLLHGRGSTAREFAEDFFASTLANGESLAARLPSWRWVFPSSRELWSTAFQETMPAWFEAQSLTDISARQDLQIDGILESVKHVQAIAKDEIDRLNGRAEMLFLGGISQGGAVGLWTLLSDSILANGLGGFVGASTWLPFAANIGRISAKGHVAGSFTSAEADQEFDPFVEGKLSTTIIRANNAHGLLTPVLLGHGLDDAYVDVGLGRQAAQVLRDLGMRVTWKEYVGAEEEGHWYKVPEEMEDIHKFLSTPRSNSN